jgi:hypothetical protein
VSFRILGREGFRIARGGVRGEFQDFRPGGFQDCVGGVSGVSFRILGREDFRIARGGFWGEFQDFRPGRF